LVLDPYFTATKLAWALQNVEGAAGAAAGTVDSWLVARLSAGRDHLTDASNASRTLLFDLGRGEWSEEMADVFGVSLANLPEVVDSSGVLSTSSGEIVAPIAGVAGDQQAALFGQACTTEGMAKNTYGTGSFVLMQTGPRRVASRSGARSSSPGPLCSGCAMGSASSPRRARRDPLPLRCPTRAACSSCRPSSASAPPTGTPTPAAPSSA